MLSKTNGSKVLRPTRMGVATVWEAAGDVKRGEEKSVVDGLYKVDCVIHTLSLY